MTSLVCLLEGKTRLVLCPRSLPVFKCSCIYRRSRDVKSVRLFGRISDTNVKGLSPHRCWLNYVRVYSNMNCARIAFNVNALVRPDRELTVIVPVV